MRVMGINCDNAAVYIAVVEDGDVSEGRPERILIPEGLEREDQLGAVFDDVGRVMDEIAPDRIILLRPEPTYSASHEVFTPRITLEALVRLAAARKGISLDRMSRQGLRSSLGLPRKGALDSHLASVLTEPVGGYWRSGRGLAAMAAVAGEKA
jgi:hypothetical protein